MRVTWILRRLLRIGSTLLVGAILLGHSTILPSNQLERVRAFTRQLEFDYLGWTLKAFEFKLFEASLSVENYLSAETRKRMILDYIELISKIQQLEQIVKVIYADPAVSNPQEMSAPYRETLESLYAERERTAPFVESILQDQLSVVVAELNLTLGGQPIPPILYHVTPLPLALIVSPRHVIRQDQDISLDPKLPVEKWSELEQRVDRALNVSSLVVNIGGVGMYPTMVLQTSSLGWLGEVVAHEWTHNFLTLRPLGMNYFTSPELRVMNETTANIAGREIGRRLLERFYPELIPPELPPQQDAETSQPMEEVAFDFRKEMHTTRLKVDELLAQGKIREAELYMEARRKVFWEQGFLIRKLNQAYFAFHGAYADEPGGAAGAIEDPVGEAVRALRARSPSLADFLNWISWMTSFEQLQQALQERR